MGVNNPSAAGLRKIKADAQKDTLKSKTKDPKAGKGPEPRSALHHKGKRKSK